MPTKRPRRGDVEIVDTDDLPDDWVPAPTSDVRTATGDLGAALRRSAWPILKFAIAIALLYAVVRYEQQAGALPDALKWLPRL